jgi:hypothetical protein
MTIQLEVWHLLTLLGGLISAYFVTVKLIFVQADRRLEDRFKSQDEARKIELNALSNSISQRSEQEQNQLKRLPEIEKSLSSHGERITRLEADVAHVPTHEDLASIHRRVDEIVKEVGRLPGIERLLHSIDDYLRETK